MFRNLSILLAAGTGLLTTVLHAQNVVAFSSQSASVYAGNPFSKVTSFSSGSGSFTAVAKPDGSKYYVVANSGTQTVTVVDGSFSNAHSLGAFNPPATAAAITPDGGRLVVAAGTVRIFDTGTDTELVPGGLNTGFNVFDVAISLDGSMAYVLATNGVGGGQLNAIDLSTNTVLVTSIGFSVAVTGVTVGLNGRLYVSTQNRILEMNPANLTRTPGGAVGVSGRPGKPVFTPEGRYALVPNSTPNGFQTILLIDLSTHTIVSSVPTPGNVVIDSLLAASSSTVFALSSQQQSLYQVTISGGSLSIDSVPLLPPGPVTAMALSNEVGGGGRSTAQQLFVAAPGTLYRLDLVLNQITGQVPLDAPVGALSFVTPAVTAGPVSTILQYGDNQTIPPGGTTLPLVVRVLDGQGRPLSGVTVTFVTGNSDATVSPDTATTGSAGFAQTTVNAPSNGNVSVTATAGGHTAVFFVHVAPLSSTAAFLSLVAGQGQLVIGSASPGSPLTVKVTDINGDPVPGVAVVFSLTSGSGTLPGGTPPASPSTISVMTGANGLASATFLPTVILFGTGYVQSTITASAPGTGTVTFFVTNTSQESPATVEILRPQPGDILVGQAGTLITSAFAARISVPSLPTRRPVPNVSIRVNSPGDPALYPSATCSDPTGMGVLSDAVTGVVICNLLLNGKAGTNQVTGNVGYQPDTTTVTLRITPGGPGMVDIVQGNRQSGKPGQQLPLPLVVQVSDSFGNLLPGTPVTWQVLTPGAVVLSSIFSGTDIFGRAAVTATLGNVAGQAQVRVSAGSASATFTLTVNIAVAGLQKISGDGQSTVINASFASPLVVGVVDSQGNGVAGAQVTFTVTAGSATVGAQATTDASGQASTGVVAGPNAGTITIAAASSGFSVTFTLTSYVPGPRNLTFVSAASFQPGLSPGAIVVIAGNGIAPGIQGVVTGLNVIGVLPTNIAGASVTFNGIAAPMFNVANVNGSEFVTVLVPFEIQPGAVNVTINATDGTSATVSATVQLYSPGVFVTAYGNQTVAAALRPDGSAVSPTNPARLGEVIRVLVTGLGQVTPPTATNRAGVPGQSVTGNLVVGLNNAGVTLISAEYAPGFQGVYVVTLQVPLDTQPGPAQPFGLIESDSANNAYVAPSTFLPIQ